MLAVVRANVGVLTADPQHEGRYIGLTDIPPDSLRQPVTVYAVARALRLPYETVRRHVKKLKDAGVCVAVAGGVIVPAGAIMSPTTLAGVVATWRRTKAFVAEAGRFGIVAQGEVGPQGRDMSRQVVRLANEYFLDALLIMADAVDLDVLGVLVLRAVAVANVERLAHDPSLGSAFAGLVAIPRDEHRDPVSVYAISRHLLLPYETARRTVLRLADQGLLKRLEGGGLLVPAEVIARPNVVAGTVQLADRTLVFLKRLAELGVSYQTSTSVAS